MADAGEGVRYFAFGIASDHGSVDSLILYKARNRNELIQYFIDNWEELKVDTDFYWFNSIVTGGNDDDDDEEEEEDEDGGKANKKSKKKKKEKKCVGNMTVAEILDGLNGESNGNTIVLNDCGLPIDATVTSKSKGKGKADKSDGQPTKRAKK